MPATLPRRPDVAGRTKCPQSADWRGSLTLSLSNEAGSTRITRRQHSGPLLIQRPFYPEGKQCCHIYLLHPPGGLVGGDQLSCHFDLAAGSQALVTTPSAGKAYRVDADDRVQGFQANIDMAQCTSMEWLPQETIAFDGARLYNSTRIKLKPDSALIGWDILCLGRPASGETFATGSVRQRLEIWCENKPLLLERTDYVGSDRIMRSAWGLDGRAVVGTMYAYCPNPTQRDTALAIVRELSANCDSGTRCAATYVNNVLLVRSLGSTTESLRLLFTRIWQGLRPCILERDACTPRIWQT